MFSLISFGQRSEYLPNSEIPKAMQEYEMLVNVDVKATKAWLYPGNRAPVG